jgi:hypothetical protein
VRVRIPGDGRHAAIQRTQLATPDRRGTLLLVPGARRAATLTRTLAESPVPIAVRPWTPADGATLDLVTHATDGGNDVLRRA